MGFVQFINGRRLIAAGALAAMVWCGQARGQVLDQVPSDAVGVLEIKSLEGMNVKVAKMAKSFGLDELRPELKDPLAAVLTMAHLTKGIDKSGDAALAVLAPNKGGDEPEPVGIVPVSDYEAFLTNFQKAPDGSDGAITAVIDPDNAAKKMYVVHHGKYAVLSSEKGQLTGKVGIQLSPAVTHELESKDLVFAFNMTVLRGIAIPALKENRAKMVEEMHRKLAREVNLKAFIPVIDTVLNEVLDGSEAFLTDANGIVFSAEISDAGLTGSTLIDFAADSKFGKTVAELKAGPTPLLAGLPDRKYFFFAGASMDPKVIGAIAEEWLNPVIKDLNATNSDVGKQIAGTLDALKVMVNSSNHSAVGWIVPTKPLGQESLLQEVSVAYGNSAKIAAAQRGILTGVNSLMAMGPQNQMVKTKIEFGDPRTVAGVDLQTYTTKIDFDPADPRGMQAQGMLKMIYGPNGNSGVFGPVNESAFIVAQGVDDETLKELIDSARAQKDPLGESPSVKAVTSHLPANRSAIYYVALDNIVTTAVRYAQGLGAAVKVKLPQNLPPVGIAFGTEGSSVRIDAFVPTETVQSLIAAGIQAYTQMQAGGGGGL